MSTNLPYVCPLCGAAMTTEAKCPCEKFERLLAAAKDATAFFIPVDEMYRRLRVLAELITALDELKKAKEAKWITGS